MVNIAGRSKGCSTCRKRRIKCDETRPICLKCQRLGLECDGPKGTTFVSASIVKSRRKIETSTSTAAPDPDTTRAPSSALIQVNSPTNWNAQITTPTALLPGTPQEYYIMFARQHLDPSGPIDTALQELLLSTQYLLHAPSGPNDAMDMTQAHLPTVLSFATLVFGTYHNDAAIKHRGLVAHGATLRRINATLSHPDCWRFDSVLVAVTTLAIQEAMAPSSPVNYLEHMLGIDRLLALRDPAERFGPDTLGLYKCVRHLIVFAALRRGRASVLAAPGWKEVMRDAVVGDEERMQNEVYEVLADCSVLRARWGRLRKRSGRANDIGGDEKSESYEGIQVEVEAIRREAIALQSQLLIWRALWDADALNIPIEMPPSPASPPDPFAEFTNDPPCLPPLDTSDLIFLNPVSGLMILLYDITMLYTLDVLISLPGNDKREELVSAQNNTLIEMCRCVPKYQPPSARDVHASPVVHWAVRTAKDMTVEDGRVAEAVKEILTRKGGGVIARGLK